MSFQSENNDFLKFILDTAFFAGWSDPNCNSNLASIGRQSSLELYVTSDCPQKCEYCYLNKYGNKLYPLEIRHPDQILQNLEILLKYTVKNWPYLKHIDIFSGEILETDLFFNILDLILKYKKLGASYEEIVIPTNFSFILDDKATKRIQEYIDLFKENEIKIALSASIDGYLIEDLSRPQKVYRKRDMTFYDKAFAFMKKNGYCAHPMIAACSIDKWIDNYKWFIDMYNKYDLDILERLMLLEVRNDDWTNEAIESYLKFLKFYTDYHYEHKFHSNPQDFARSVLGLNGMGFGYTNFLIFDAVQFPTCTIGYQLTVRLGDLSIAPCHRTSYPELMYGQFVVKNGEIVDIIANNPVLATKILLSNQRKSHHGCDTCWNINSCIRGCFGAQYEYGDEIFMPLNSVCRLLKAKTRFIISWYQEHGIIDAIEQIMNQSADPTNKAEIEKFLKVFKETEQRSKDEI